MNENISQNKKNNILSKVLFFLFISISILVLTFIVYFLVINIKSILLIFLMLFALLLGGYFLYRVIFVSFFVILAICISIVIISTIGYVLSLLF